MQDSISEEATSNIYSPRPPLYLSGVGFFYARKSGGGVVAKQSKRERRVSARSARKQGVERKWGVSDIFLGGESE